MPTYYINADSGNDTIGNGGILTPWKTISKANTVCVTGDIVILQDASAFYQWDTVSFKGITFKANAFGNVKVGNYSGGNFWSAAVGISPSFEKIKFQSITSSTFGQANFHALSNSVWRFTDCLFTLLENTASYAHILGSSANSNQLFKYIFTRCVFYNNATGKTPFGVHSYTRTAGHNNYELYNCIYSILSTDINPTNLFGGMYTPVNVKLRNCILKTAVSSVLNYSNGTMDSDYNCINGPWTSMPTLGAHDTTSDPLFMDEAARNFNLRPSSPCIGTGTLV